MKILRNILVIVAILFGLMTIFVGSRVLLGTDPGYIVFLPLLIYNTGMGLVFVAAGIIAWRSIKNGMYMAVTILGLNLIVLITIFILYTKGSSIAVDSLQAMSFRTVVWLVLFGGFWLVSRSSKLNNFNTDA
tara:strand:+ start:28606 stop:29001 length:396 start_codon:yes stop_codon:yes gene_type:complete